MKVLPNVAPSSIEVTSVEFVSCQRAGTFDDSQGQSAIYYDVNHRVCCGIKGEDGGSQPIPEDNIDTSQVRVVDESGRLVGVARAELLDIHVSPRDGDSTSRLAQTVCQSNEEAKGLPCIVIGSSTHYDIELSFSTALEPTRDAERNDPAKKPAIPELATTTDHRRAVGRTDPQPRIATVVTVRGKPFGHNLRAPTSLVLATTSTTAALNVTSARVMNGYSAIEAPAGASMPLFHTFAQARINMPTNVCSKGLMAIGAIAAGADTAAVQTTVYYVTEACLNQCVDSDKGANPLITGSTKGAYRDPTSKEISIASLTDHCISSVMVREYFCDNAGVNSKDIACERGTSCYEGSCTSCIDTDHGEDLGVAGAAYTPGSDDYLRDYCGKDTSTIFEAKCNFHGSPKMVERECPKGTRCLSGACLRDTCQGCLSDDRSGSRERRAVSLFDQAFPNGTCGCGSVFPKDAEGSFFTYGPSPGSPLLESELQGMDRAQVGQLYLHGVDNYFGRIGFTLLAISMENATEYAITSDKLGITIDSYNDFPTIAASTMALASVAQDTWVSLPSITITDADALDGAVLLSFTASSEQRFFYTPALDRNIHEVQEDPRGADPVDYSEEYVLQGQGSLVLAVTLTNGMATVSGVSMLTKDVDASGILTCTVTDRFWSPLPRGSEGVASVNITFAVSAAASAGASGVWVCGRSSSVIAYNSSADMAEVVNVTLPAVTNVPASMAVTVSLPGHITASPVLVNPVSPAEQAAWLEAVTFSINTTGQAETCAYQGQVLIDGVVVMALDFVPLDASLAEPCGFGYEAQNLTGFTLAVSATTIDEDTSTLLRVAVQHATESAVLDLALTSIDGSIVIEGGLLAPGVASLYQLVDPMLINYGGASSMLLRGNSSALSTLTFRFTPYPNFNGIATVQATIAAAGASSNMANEDVARLINATTTSVGIVVTPVDDVVFLSTLGQLYLDELTETQLWDMRVLDGDGNADTFTVGVATNLGALTMSAAGQAAVSLVGGPLPASSFSMTGDAAAIAVGMNALVYQALSCQFEVGTCESRFSFINISVTDSQGHMDMHRILIDVTCIAEVPLLDVPDVRGDEDTAIALPITTSPRDPLESLVVFIKDIPAGVTFSSGQQQGSRWRVETYELVGLTVSAPPNSHTDFNLTVQSVATEITNGDTAMNEVCAPSVRDALASIFTLLFLIRRWCWWRWTLSTTRLMSSALGCSTPWKTPSPRLVQVRGGVLVAWAG